MSTTENVRLAALSDAQRALLQKRMRGELKPKSRPAIEPRATPGPAPLTSSQRGVWTAENMYPGRSVWNLTDAFWMHGQLDVPRFEAALDECFRRHEVFRIAVRPSLPPMMELEDDVTLPFTVLDLSHQPRGAAREAALEQAGVEASTGFDIARASLLKVLLIRVATDEHLLIFKLHHLVGDGWSFGIVVSEVQEAYAALTEGRAPRLPPLPIQFADFAVAEHRRIDERHVAAVEEIASALADAPRLSTLPSAGRRPSVFDVAGACHRFTVPRETVTAAEHLGRRVGATPFVVMLTAFLATLARLADQDDVVVGTPTANRRHPEVEPLVGMFVNTMVQRLRTADAMTFAGAIAQVGAGVLKSLRHQHVPFEDVLAALALPRDVSLHPLFQVMFVFQNWPFPALQLPGVTIRRADVHPATSKYDLTVVLEERDGELEGYIEYATRLYTAPQVSHFAESFCQLLAEGCADPARELKNLLSPDLALQRQILDRWDATAASAPFVPVHRAFEQTAAQQGDAVAVRFADDVLSYADLDRRADATAALMIERGWRAGDRVGLLLARDLSLPEGLLACLKTGVTYVPLDLRHPQDRLRAILDSAGVDKVLTNPGAEPVASALARDVIVCAGQSLSAAADRRATSSTPGPEDLAYIICTSGSTGVPKAVAVSHGNFSMAVASCIASPGLAPADRVLSTATLAFDAHVMDLVAPLVAGASVRLAEDRDAADPDRLMQLAQNDCLTVIQATPSTWRLLQQAEWTGALGLRAFVGAEHLDPDLARWLQRCFGEVWHLYGVTECSVWQAGGRLSPDDLDGGIAPIGGPLPGHRVLVLDDTLRLLAPGMVGQIHIGGAGVACGYLENEPLTRQAFVSDPFGEPGERMYRTGDLGRLRPDGKLEILGRRDQQVKVRGSRVELGDVEAALLQVQGVRAACVLLTDGGLRAFVVVDDRAALTRGGLRQTLARGLPEFMLPDAYATVDALPVNANGKIDRNRLISLGRSLGDGPRLAPQNAAEVRVAAIWADILGASEFGATDGFFDVGGTSLNAFELLTRLRAEGCADLNLIEIFEFPTIRDMARRMTGGQGLIADEVLTAIAERSTARRERARATRRRTL